MLTKYLLPLVAVIGFGGGTFFGSKVLDKKCPDCAPKLTCPDNVSVELSNFDIDKINNKKGTFHLTNTLSNVRIVIEQKDSALLKQILKSAR
jgi:hypothetical protein